MFPLMVSLWVWVESPFGNQLIIVCVRTDPVPDDLVTIANPDGTVAESDSHGINRLLWMDLLKAQAWMMGVF